MNEILKIKISEIDDFKNHPYKVELGDELNDLVESIKLNGLLVPIVVRRKEDNRYELLSGHRRKKVYEILGLEEIDAIVKELNDNDATIYMVDSNMYREKLLPSEKAFAYRMKMDAMKHQGKASCHYDTKLRSDEKLAEKSNDVRVENNIDKMFIEISTRNARFENMTIDEKIKEIANLIENLLCADGNFIKLDYSKYCFKYIDDEIIKNYRKQIQCFRHASNNALEERKQFSKWQKEFLIDYGITIIKLIHSLKK